jgi:hypothetical protein
MKTTLNACLDQLFNDDTSLKPILITTDEITDLAVTTAKIADLAVTTAKLAAGALSVTAAGHAIMSDGYLCSDPGTFAGILTIGQSYRIDSLAGGDNFTNVGYVSAGIPFTATATTPTTWTTTIVTAVATGARGTKAPALVSGRTYRIDTLLAGDIFTNVGYVSDGVVFTATGTTPTTWANGTVVVDTVLEEGLAKMADLFLTANTAGRAKMQNGYINSDKLAEGSVTNDKIAADAVTLSKVDLTGFPLDNGVAMWNGVVYNQLLASAVVQDTTTAYTVLELASGNHHITVPTTVNNTTALMILQQGVAVDGVSDILDNSISPGPTGLACGKLYHARPTTSNGTPTGSATGFFVLYNTAADCLADTSRVVIGGDHVLRGSCYIIYIEPTSIARRDCDVIPLCQSGNASSIPYFKVQWRTPFSTARYPVLFQQNNATWTGDFNPTDSASLATTDHIIINHTGAGGIGASGGNTTVISYKV